jgi:hypothetical protein
MIPAWEERNIQYQPHPRFVFVEDGKVLGWVAIAPVSTRKA